MIAGAAAAATAVFRKRRREKPWGLSVGVMRSSLSSNQYLIAPNYHAEFPDVN
jgi:hypothetical protein